MSDARSARARELVLEHGWNATAYQILNPGIAHWFARAGDAVDGLRDAERRARRRGCARVRGRAAARRGRGVRSGCARRGRSRMLLRRRRAARARAAARRPMRHRRTRRAAELGSAPVGGNRRAPSLAARATQSCAQQERRRRELERRACTTTTRSSSDCSPSGSRDSGFRRSTFSSRRTPSPSRATAASSSRREASVAIAYLVASPVPARRGWLIEQIVRGHAAPNGTSELLVDAAMRALAHEGAEYVTLGLAPLSRQSRWADPAVPAWLRLAAALDARARPALLRLRRPRSIQDQVRAGGVGGDRRDRRSCALLDARDLGDRGRVRWWLAGAHSAYARSREPSPRKCDGSRDR